MNAMTPTDLASMKAEIQATIRQNGVGGITGIIVQKVLLDQLNVLDAIAVAAAIAAVDGEVAALLPGIIAQATEAGTAAASGFVTAQVQAIASAAGQTAGSAAGTTAGSAAGSAAVAAATTFTDGIDPFPTPLITRDRNWMWLTDISISGNGTSDDTTNIQRQMNKAVSQGKQLLIPSNINLRTTAPLSVSGRLVMEGHGFDVYNNTAEYPNTHGNGSLFFFDHLGVGINVDAAAGNQYACDHIIRRFGTSRRQTTPVPGQPFIPVGADFDIVLNNANGLVENISIMGSTNGIKVVNGLALEIKRIRGQSMADFVYVQNSYDTMTIDDLHYWPYWSLSPEVAAYNVNNSHVLHLGRVDTPFISKVFGFQAYALMRFNGWVPPNGAGGGGVASGILASRLVGDGCRYGILVDVATDYVSMQVDSIELGSDSIGTTPDHLINILSNYSRFDIGSARLTSARGSLINLDSSTTGNRFVIGDLVEGTWNAYTPSGQAQGANMYPALNAPGGNLITVQSWLRAGPNETQYRNGPADSSGAARANGNVKAVLSESVRRVNSDSNGAITVSHNAGMMPSCVDIMQVKSAGVAPFGRVTGIDATNFYALVFDANTGGRITSTNNIDVFFRASTTNYLP